MSKANLAENKKACGILWGASQHGGHGVLYLTGTYFHTFDSKWRVTIPARWRAAMDPAEHGSGFHAVVGYDGELCLYTPRSSREADPQPDPRLMAVEAVRDIRRLKYGLSADLDVDRLGRVRVPEPMLRLCKIGKEVALVGVQDHVEIWDQARWENYVASKLPEKGRLATQALAAESEGVLEPAGTPGGAAGKTPKT